MSQLNRTATYKMVSRSLSTTNETLKPMMAAALEVAKPVPAAAAPVAPKINM